MSISEQVVRSCGPSTGNGCAWYELADLLRRLGAASTVAAHGNESYRNGRSHRAWPAVFSRQLTAPGISHAPGNARSTGERETPRLDGDHFRCAAVAFQTRDLFGPADALLPPHVGFAAHPGECGAGRAA